MGFFSYLFGRRSAEKREANVRLTIGVNGVSVGSFSNVRVSGDDALSVTAYKRALDVLSGSVARLPFRYLRQKGGIYTEYDSSEYHYLLAMQPQLRMSAFDWKFQMVWRALHDGDAYIYPRFFEGSCAELVLLSRGSCSYDDMNDTYIVNDMYNGVSGTFKGPEIIHIMFNTDDGRTGTPLWKIGAKVLAVIATGDQETLERFGKGGAVRGIITNDKSGLRGLGEYQDEELAGLANATDLLFKNGERIVALPGNVDFTQMSSSSTDMQFLESRKFAITEMSRLTGVPPIYLFDMAGSNYKMPEQADTAFLTQTLDRLLTSIESEFQRKLVGRAYCCKRKFEFDRRRIFSMDLNSMATYEQKMIQNGVFTINDVRKLENQAPVEHGDTVYISTNLAEIGSEKLSGNAPQNEDQP